MRVHNSHTLFAPSDFTEEEIERRNVLAVAVLDEGRKICKRCGREDDQLELPCPRTKAWKSFVKRLSSKQTEVLKRCLGLDYDGKITRNFITQSELGADESVAIVLLNKGLLRKTEVRQEVFNGVAEVEPTYQVTREGIQALKLNDIKVGE